MSASITIDRLSYGFLVRSDGMNIAAISGPSDLAEWIRNWSAGPRAAEEDGKDPEPSVPTEETITTIPDEVLADAYPEYPVEETPPAPEQDPQPPAQTVADDAAEEAMKRQTIDEQAIKLVGYLDKQGASRKWVKASYTDIGGLLDVTPPAIAAVVQHAKEKFPRLRVVRVMSGEARGNNFTFNPDIPGPDALLASEDKKPAPTESPLEDAVLAFLRQRREKAGMDEFTATLSSIAKAIGVAPAAVVNITTRLSSRGVIKRVRESNGIPVWCFVDGGAS